jgi:hypothetical protein
MERLIATLERKLSKPLALVDYAWPVPSLNILDCVLSLNRKYERVCLPRVQRFAAENPSVRSVRELRDAIHRSPSPLEFLISKLDYKDAGRADTLLGVTEYLSRVQRRYPGETEIARLRRWAESTGPDSTGRPDVPGFALSGLQYLRMLFGVQTAKPDTHVRRFVSRAIRAPSVTDKRALNLLEDAARERNLRVRDLDHKIWKSFARRHRGLRESSAMMASLSKRTLPLYLEWLFGFRFEGFLTINELKKKRARAAIPSAPGTYFVVKPMRFMPKFRAQSPAGQFKGQDPTVAIDRLRDAWVDGSPVLYVGKAGGANQQATLRSRIECYLSHGQGHCVAHWGGRFISQLKRSGDLLIAWHAEKQVEPRDNACKAKNDSVKSS